MKPNKSESKQLALLVTDKDIIQLFIDTLAKHKDWKATSVVNMGMTKGAAFNILKHIIMFYDTAGASSVFGLYMVQT